MPYIKEEDRNKLHKMNKINYEEINTAGELQYVIAVLIKSFIIRKGLNYQNCNDIMGALAGAQMEFYRRTVGPYEDLAKERNGDV